MLLRLSTVYYWLPILLHRLHAAEQQQQQQSCKRTTHCSAAIIQQAAAEMCQPRYIVIYRNIPIKSSGTPISYQYDSRPYSFHEIYGVPWNGLNSKLVRRPFNKRLVFKERTNLEAGKTLGNSALVLTTPSLPGKRAHRLSRIPKTAFHTDTVAKTSIVRDIMTSKSPQIKIRRLISNRPRPSQPPRLRQRILGPFDKELALFTTAATTTRRPSFISATTAMSARISSRDDRQSDDKDGKKTFASGVVGRKRSGHHPSQRPHIGAAPRYEVAHPIFIPLLRTHPPMTDVEHQHHSTRSAPGVEEVAPSFQHEKYSAPSLSERSVEGLKKLFESLVGPFFIFR